MSTLPHHNNKVLLNTQAGLSVFADSTPPPVSDPNERRGWLFVKSDAADKFNYYIYGQGSHPMKLSEFGGAWFVANIDNWVDVSSAPFFTVYTKPLGDGLDGGLWYRTRRTYCVASRTHICLGKRQQFNTEALNTNTIYPFEQTHLSNTIVTGPNDPSEEILTMAIHSDSASPLTTQILVAYAGFYRKNTTHSANIYLSS